MAPSFSVCGVLAGMDGRLGSPGLTPGWRIGMGPFPMAIVGWADCFRGGCPLQSKCPRRTRQRPHGFSDLPRAFSVTSTRFCWLLASQEATQIQLETNGTSPLDGGMARSHCRRTYGMGDIVGTSSENYLPPH